MNSWLSIFSGLAGSLKLTPRTLPARRHFPEPYRRGVRPSYGYYWILERSTFFSRDNVGRTPLSIAAQCLDVAVDALVKIENVDVESEDQDGWTPLFWAIYGLQENAVNCLLDTGRVNIAHYDKQGRTAASIAAQSGNMSMLEYLLEKGLSLDKEDNKGWTPLFWASRYGRLAAIQFFRNKSVADFGRRDKSGRTVTSTAAEVSGFMIMEEHIGQDAGVDEEDENGWTPLFWAGKAGNEDTTACLLESGKADVHHLDKSGLPVHRASMGMDCDYALSKILEYGADVEFKDCDGETPLFWAMRTKSKPILQTVISIKCNLEHQNSVGRTALSVSAGMGQIRASFTLLNAGANPSAQDPSGWTSVFWAVKGEAPVKLVERLLEADTVDLEHRDASGRTVLSIAAELGRKTLATLLVDRNANKAAQDDEGHTPMYWAEKGQHKSIIKLLRSKNVVRRGR